MQKRILAALMALLLAAALAGCSRQSDGEAPGTDEQLSQGEAGESAPEEEEAENEAAEPAGETREFVCDWQGDLLLYRYHANLGSDTEPLFLPVRRQLFGQIDVAALQEMIRQEFEGEAPDFTLTVQGDTATFAFDGRVWGIDEDELLMTLWATLTQNDTGIAKVRFLAYDEPYASIFMELALDAEGCITGQEILLPDHSMEELAALRAQLPFSPREDLYSGEPLLQYPVQDDVTARTLANFIHQVTMWNLPEQSFEQVSQAPPAFVITAGIQLAGSLPMQFRVTDMPDLGPLYQASGGYESRVQEHVDQAAQLLFGADVPPVQHNATGPWHYMEYAGVYKLPYPNMLDSHALYAPLLVAYEELEDRYEVEAVFLRCDSSYELFYDGFGNELPAGQLAAYVLETAPRHRITLGKTDYGFADQAIEGGLVYQAHQLPEIARQANSAIDNLPKEQLRTDTLVSVRRRGEQQAENSNSPVFDAEDDWFNSDTDDWFSSDMDDSFSMGSHIVFVNVGEQGGGVDFDIIPTYTGSTLRVEELDWENGSQQVKEVMYEAQAQDGYVLRLGVEESAGAKFRLVVEYGGQSAEYLFLSGGGGATSPAGVLLLDAA